MSLRRRGPGLWWSATCVGLALGAMIVPTRGELVPVFIPSLGGLAGTPVLGPETWALLLLAIELMILHGATERSRGEECDRPAMPRRSA